MSEKRQVLLQGWCQSRLVRSRNIGIGLAKGLYLRSIDGDDFYNSQGLDALLRYAHRAPLIFSSHCVLNDVQMSMTALSEVTLDLMLGRNHISIAAFLVERSSIAGDFSQNMHSLEKLGLPAQSDDPQRNRLHAQPPSGILLARLPDRLFTPS